MCALIYKEGKEKEPGLCIMREFESRVMRGKSEVEVVVEALFLSHEHNLAAVDRAAEEDMR